MPVFIPLLMAFKSAIADKMGGSPHGWKEEEKKEKGGGGEAAARSTFVAPLLGASRSTARPQKDAAEAENPTVGCNPIKRGEKGGKGGEGGPPLEGRFSRKVD